MNRPAMPAIRRTNMAENEHETNKNMGPSERANGTTYEDQYRSLGYLFYSIAACDRSIIQAEINILKEMTARHWLVEDRNYDELGIESARYIDIAFDQALEQRLSSKDAYGRFVEDQLREPRRFDGWTKRLILRTAVEIAKASGSMNHAEATRIGDLQKLLGLFNG